MSGETFRVAERRTRSRDSRQGIFVIIYFAIALIVLLGFVGLAVDVGRMELRTIQLQAVADDAAMTGAAEYQNGKTNWQTFAQSEATAAAAATGLSNVTSAFQLHSNTGAYTLDYSAIQATVTQSLPLYFMGLVTGTKTKTLTVISVADAQPCSYFTNPYTYSVHLASTGFYGNCPVYAVGSISNDYFSSMTAGQVKVTGLQAASYTTGRFYSSSQPIYQAPVLPDPLAYITPPVFTACTPGDIGLRITVPTTITPGTYCGGLTVVATTVTLVPGLYIFTGGLNLTTGSTITGTGVTLYFTQGGGFSFGTVTFGTLAHSNTTFANLSAPTDNTAGGIPGIVLFTDRNWTGSGQLDFHGCTWVGDGIFYSVAAGVSIQYVSMYGNSYFGMDAYYLYEYQSSLSVSSNYATLPGGNPFHIAATLVQ